MKQKALADTAPLKTRRQKVEDREQTIVSAARTLFNDKGYAKTTISDIATKSRVADGTVYLYFKNKEALASEVLAQFYHELTEQAQLGVDELTSAVERFHFMARHHMTSIIENRRLLEALPQTALTLDNYEGSEFYKMNRAYVSVFDRVAKDGAAQGIVRPEIAPWILRDMFFGAMDYGSRTILMRGSLNDIEAFVEGLMGLFIIPKSARSSQLGLSFDSDNQLELITRRLERAVQQLERRS